MHIYSKSVHTNTCNKQSDVCYLSYFHVHTAINILRCFGYPREQLWACFNTEPNRLYRRLRLFPSKLQEYTPPPFSRLSTQYHIDPLLTCFLSLDTSRTSLRLQESTKFGNRHTAHRRYEYSYNLANSRENWAQKKKIATGTDIRSKGAGVRGCEAAKIRAKRPRAKVKNWEG